MGQRENMYVSTFKCLVDASRDFFRGCAWLEVLGGTITEAATDHGSNDDGTHACGGLYRGSADDVLYSVARRYESSLPVEYGSPSAA